MNYKNVNTNILSTLKGRSGYHLSAEGKKSLIRIAILWKKKHQKYLSGKKGTI